MRLMEAQARRLRGLTAPDRDDLAAALALFVEIGAARYAARLRAELATLEHDAGAVAAARAELASLGEADLPTANRDVG